MILSLHNCLHSVHVTIGTASLTKQAQYTLFSSPLDVDIWRYFGTEVFVTIEYMIFMHMYSKDKDTQHPTKPRMRYAFSDYTSSVS